MNLTYRAKPQELFYYLFIACFAGLLLFLHLRLYQYGYDDAYIHFRVAQNLFQSGKPFYNINEMVKVSTSSGWVIFLTGLVAMLNLLKMDISLPLIVSILNCMFTVGGMHCYTAVIESLLGLKLSLPRKILFQVAYASVLISASIGLMETSLALLLAGLGILLLIRSNPAGFSLLAVSIYFRLELLALFGLVAFSNLINKRYKGLAILGYSIAGILPLIVFDLYFYHTVIPHSVIAKSIVYTNEWFITLLSELFISLPIGSLYFNPLSLFLTGTIMLCTISVTFLATIRELKDNKFFWPMIFWSWGILVAASYIVSHTYIFDWYIPLFIIPIFVSSFLLLKSIDQKRNIVITFFQISFFVIFIIPFARATDSGIKNPVYFSLFELGSRVKTYLSVGRILNEEYPSANLLSSEIGGLGYSFRGEILDAGGLASPAALKYHPLKVPEQRASGYIGAIPPGYVAETHPDIIVTYDIFAKAILNSDVLDQYNLILIPAYLPEDQVYTTSDTIWGSRYLRIYIRKDLPVSDLFKKLRN